MFRIAISSDFARDVRGKFEPVLEKELGGISGLEWTVIPELTTGEEAPAGILADYDALFALAPRITAASLHGAERLAIIARWGVGYDNVDIPACTAADVVVAITPNGVRRSVAESVVCFIFALGMRLPEQQQTVAQGQWRANLPRFGQCVEDRVLGLLGCGNIGREIVRMCGAMGFRRIIAHDPFYTGGDVELVSLEELFTESDYVSVNCPLNDQTRGMVNAHWLRQMKPTAYLINTARGPIVNQKDLTVALNEGWIAGAGLDVFEVEPLPMDDPIRQCPNTILTPHGLCWTEEIIRDNSRNMFENTLAVMRGQAPPYPVNRDVLQRPGFLKKLERYR